MKRSGFSEEQIILQVTGKVWGHGCFRGHAPTPLEEENARLSKMIAEQALDISIPKDVLSKNF